jgi:hypothetical protein
MSVTSFVSGSALLLALWLGVTFFHQVSPLDNPNLPRTTAATNAPLPTTGESVEGPASELAVSEP